MSDKEKEESLFEKILEVSKSAKKNMSDDELKKEELVKKVSKSLIEADISFALFTESPGVFGESNYSLTQNYTSFYDENGNDTEESKDFRQAYLKGIAATFDALLFVECRRLEIPITSENRIRLFKNLCFGYMKDIEPFIEDYKKEFNK